MGAMKRLATAKLYGPAEVRRAIYGNKKPTVALRKAVKEWLRVNK